jgi:HD-like signal output (HDOD) protein
MSDTRMNFMDLKTTEVLPVIKSIPSHQAVAREVLNICSRPEIDIPQFMRLISSDQILTAQILKIANSSLYNFPRMIPSLDQAMVVLGFNIVKEISLALSLNIIFKGPQLGKTAAVNYLWKHSLQVALTMKVIAEKYDSENKELLYFSGLLHDVGKVIILSSFDQEYALLIEKSLQENSQLLELEKKYLGVDHSDIGGRLLDEWDIPASIVLLTRYHHRPEEYKSGQKIDFSIRLIYLGNLVAHLQQRHLSRYSDLVMIEPNFKDYLSISEKEFGRLLQEVTREIEGQRPFIKLFEANPA